MEPYVSPWYEGNSPTPEKPRSVPIEDCIGKLGLRKHHHRPGFEPPKTPSDNPHLDGFRHPTATVVYVPGDDTPGGWVPGWYMIPAADLPISKAREILEGYPVGDWSDYVA